MSKNVFEDLGLANPEERLLKARLVTSIILMVENNKMTQVELAARVNMTQPAVSRLLKGMTKDISVEKLFRVILLLGHDIEITVNDTPRQEIGRLQVNKKRSEELVTV
jgi:predicted XRE-type DNA-binding protein